MTDRSVRTSGELFTLPLAELRSFCDPLFEEFFFGIGQRIGFPFGGHGVVVGRWQVVAVVVVIVIIVIVVVIIIIVVVIIVVIRRRR